MAPRVIPPPPWEQQGTQASVPPPPWEQEQAAPPTRLEQLQAMPKPTAFQREAAKHIRDTQMGQTQATYEQDISNAKARAAGQAAEMLPFAALAPMTGGTSLAAGAGIMAAAGVAGGLAREGTKAAMGSSEIPQTPAAVAKTLGIDAATGVLGEVGGRATGKVLKELLPRLVIRSAAKDQMGKTALTQMFDQTRSQISQVAGNASVDVTNAYHTALNELSALPSGTGKLGGRLTQMSEKANAIFSDIRKDVGLAGGSVAKSTQQPLDALIEMRGRLNQIAWDQSAVTGREGAILQRFADNLDKDIRAGLAAVGGDATALYNQANSILKIQTRQEIGTRVVEDALKRMASRGIYAGTAGGLGGGYLGYRRGGPVGAIKGAAEGAVAGAALGAASVVPSKLSAWAVDYINSNPAAKAELSRAIDFYMKGDTANWAASASRAVTVAGIRDHVKEAIRHPETLSDAAPPAPAQ